MIDLVWLLKTTVKDKKFILAITALMYCMFVGAYFRATPNYLSLSKWISLPENPALQGLQGFGGLFGANIGAASSDFANYDDIINSTIFLEPLLDKKVFLSVSKDSFYLKDVLVKSDFEKNKINNFSDSSSMDIQTRLSLCGALKSNINFVSRSPIYQLQIKTWDPGLSQSLNYRIIERAIEYNANERHGKSKKKRQFLESQLNTFKTSLRYAEDQLVDFQLRNNDVKNPALAVQRERLIREVEINNQLVLEFRKQFEISRADEDNEVVKISVIEKPTYPYSKKSPSSKLFFGGGLFSSLVLSIALMLLFRILQKKSNLIFE